MLRRFLRDSSIYMISATLSRGVAIIMIPLYTRFLHPSEYGVLDLLMIAATLVNYLVSLEISQGLARIYSEARTEEEKISCVSSAAWFVVLAYAIFALLGISSSSHIALFLLNSQQWTTAVKVMILAVVANGVFFLLQDLLRWQIQPARHALASITYSFISASVGALLVVIGEMGVVGILLGQIAGAIVGLYVTCANGAALHWMWRFDRSCLLEMLRYSMPQVISSFAAYSALYIDRIFIKEMNSVEDVGVYGVGARIASLVAILMVGFQSGYIPIVFQNHAAVETPLQMARVFRYFLVGAFAALLFLAGFSKELLWVFTTPQYYGAWFTIPILAAAMLLANMYIFVPGVFIARRTGLVAITNVGTALFNITCIILLLPRFGVAGAAIATLAGSLANFLIYVRLNARFYPIPFEWRRIITGCIAGLVFACILIVLQNISGLWLLTGKTLLFLFGVIIIVITLLEENELKQIPAKFGWQFNK